jgi:hypothetical protein
MDEKGTNQPMWASAARKRGLIPQPHGRALMPGGGFRFGAGRPKSRVKLALEQAKGDPLRQLEIARQCRDDESLPVSKRLRAINFLLKLARLDREESRHPNGAAFRVMRRMPEETPGSSPARS